MDFKVINGSNFPVLKALLAFMPDAKGWLPKQPQKADFIAKVKELLGGAGAPTFSEVRQLLNNKKPIEPAAMLGVEVPTAAAPAATAGA
mmetsp:Transcript_11717/g.25480  ORF Transcript_11717/g.25480 Transcript_11717/m.25480 type:complete len:89 (-) Transcript_11717:8-274(-)